MTAKIKFRRELFQPALLALVLSALLLSSGCSTKGSATNDLPEKDDTAPVSTDTEIGSDGSSIGDPVAGNSKSPQIAGESSMPVETEPDRPGNSEKSGIADGAPGAKKKSDTSDIASKSTTPEEVDVTKSLNDSDKTGITHDNAEPLESHASQSNSEPDKNEKFNISNGSRETAAGVGLTHTVRQIGASTTHQEKTTQLDLKLENEFRDFDGFLLQKIEGTDETSSSVIRCPEGQDCGNNLPVKAGDNQLGEDDDIVARQLRRAAENEGDPELKEKLWEEYYRYKENQS